MLKNNSHCNHEHNHEHKHHDESCHSHEHGCCCGHSHEHGHNHGEEENIKASIARLILGIIVAFTGIYFEHKLGVNTLASILIILGYCILIYRTAKSAISTLVHEHAIDETFLMSISCIGAYLIGEHLEGLMVIILYEIGEILEDKAVDKSKESIEELMDIRPEYANLKTGNEVKKVSPEDVKIGDIVIIKEGEKIPLDGKIVKVSGFDI